MAAFRIQLQLAASGRQPAYKMTPESGRTGVQLGRPQCQPSEPEQRNRGSRYAAFAVMRARQATA